MTRDSYHLNTKTQLIVLEELTRFFELLDAEFWLRGGWAVDFLLGKVTRKHSDIDIVTWIENRVRLENELLIAGYEQIPVAEPFRDRQSDFRVDNVDITFGYLAYGLDGSLIMNGLPEWEWRADSLIPQYYWLHGKKAKVVHPKQLIEEKKIYREIGRPYRQKDEESMKILYRIIAEFN
ncbi:nucleotidyltransferase domain-containing protein [Ornithinibacillus xuwenensis]|uniref:nucleotidyltransferase domain-containing protein n=1 Tax=Ornithinibacillus xuwenensis TaxID=3144668 RepID=UPI0031F581CD